MTFAKVCTCGHTKTDHHQLFHGRTKPNIGNCEWWDCSCKSFELHEIKSMNYAAKSLPTLIDASQRHYIKDEPLKQTPYHLTDCDKNGYAKNNKGYHPKRFNNGEYP